MDVRYFPGCTLKTTAKELDRLTRASAEALGIHLIEPENWQCCGGVFVTAVDEIATKLSAVRALADARDAGMPLVSVCSACHNVLRQTNHQLRTDPDFADRANRYLGLAQPYTGETRVLHFLELLRDEIGFDAVKAAVKKPLTGRKVAAYYGCLLLRPSAVMQMDDPEDPRILEELIRALGAEPVLYPRRNECCGGYVAIDDPESAAKKSRAVLESAGRREAELLVTACPLCRYNLEKHGDGTLPVVYFTDLLAEALGIKEANPQ